MEIREVAAWLESLAPLRLAEDWDNVGLLVGDASRGVHRVMTCLTITPRSAREAVDRQADLIVAHHPLPFRPLKRLTTDETVGRLLWQLIGAGISIYSPHTAWDSARAGINQQLAEALQLAEVAPLQPIVADPDQLGSGRMGRFPDGWRLGELLAAVKSRLKVDHVQYVGHLERQITQLAVACGSAGMFLQPAHAAGCDVLLTGETNFHTCLEAEALDVALVLPGHFASERFALEWLAAQMGLAFPQLEIWASEKEQDPVKWS